MSTIILQKTADCSEIVETTLTIDIPTVFSIQTKSNVNATIYFGGTLVATINSSNPFYLAEVLGEYTVQIVGTCRRADVCTDSGVSIVTDNSTRDPYNVNEVTSFVLPDETSGLWEYSEDGGSSWLPWDGLGFTGTSGATGATNRFRLTHDFDCATEVTVTIGGTKSDADTDAPGELYLDNVQVSANTGLTPSDTDVVFSVTQGTHVIEWWHGNQGGTADTIAPEFSGGYDCNLCVQLFRLTDNEGNVTWEYADGTTYVVTGSEEFGLCVDNSLDDQTHTLLHGADTDIPAGTKSVVITRLTGTVTVDGGFQLGDAPLPQSISYSASEVDGARALLPAISITGGTWQWSAILPVAEI